MKTKQIAKDFDLTLINVTNKNIKKIALKYEVEISDLKENAIIEHDEIILGIYDDNELRIAAFFHEIGHTLITERYEKLVNNDQMLIEYQAWIEGLKIAKKYGYMFSDKTFKYILKSINSYYKDAISMYNKDEKVKDKNRI